MEQDFKDFRYTIEPTISIEDDAIDLILFCTHIMTNKTSNILIDPNELRDGSIGYLFGQMQNLTHVLKGLIE